MRLLVVAGLVAVLATPVHADYLLASGDVIDVDLFGVAGFKRHVTVNIDGDVSLPFVGEVHATGSSLASLRRKVVQQLEKTGVLHVPDVTIEIIECRPFFISGDVVRPGAIAYRPGLTVRHAVALAGGYDALRFRAENPLLAAPEIRSQYDSVWVDLLRRQARALSLQAQVDGKTEADMNSLRQAPLSPRIIDDVVRLERRDFTLRLAEFDDQRRFLTQSVQQLEGDIAALQEAERKQSAAIADQMVASERVSSAQSRGVVAAVRVDEERRALAVLRAQQVDNTARLVAARQQRDDLANRLHRLTKDWQSTLNRELQDTVVEVEKLRNQARSAGERLIYVGALKAQLRAGTDGPKLTLFRRADAGVIQIEATEATDVLPDDVLDVTIRPDQLVIGPQR